MWYENAILITIHSAVAYNQLTVLFHNSLLDYSEISLEISTDFEKIYVTIEELFKLKREDEIVEK